jgi:dihydroorotate dehydrogenase
LRKSLALAPRYDWRQTYDWNFEHAPDPIERREPRVPGQWHFCGLPVSSPLGIAAGPLLNGRWILYYASLGFDVLTYKTVRSSARACYPMPNLLPVACASFAGGDNPLAAHAHMVGSWAVSFGMPSKSPEFWRGDIEATRCALPRGKVLSVSVVATPQPGWTQEDLAEDFARCAQWAVESGADCVEANFSCPNVETSDAQLYQQPPAARCVAAALRGAVGSKPLLLKIGHVTEERLATELLHAVAPHVNALVMVNCISARVVGRDGQEMFQGQRRGVAGEAIRSACLEQGRLFARLILKHRAEVNLVGVGGISTAAHVREFLDAGCHAVQLATAAMMEPEVGLKIRRELEKA